ncbi:MAG: hypothetical protein ACI396_02375 [Acutalibacteraceae bacterium]
MREKLKLHDIDVADFIKTVDSCKGNVFLETEEGDCLNLKSKLCQIAGLTTLIKGGIIVEAYIRCENPEDESKLFRFNLYKEVPEGDNSDSESK